MVEEAEFLDSRCAVLPFRMRFSIPSGFQEWNRWSERSDFHGQAGLDETLRRLGTAALDLSLGVQRISRFSRLRAGRLVELTRVCDSGAAGLPAGTGNVPMPAPVDRWAHRCSSESAARSNTHNRLAADSINGPISIPAKINPALTTSLFGMAVCSCPERAAFRSTLTCPTLLVQTARMAPRVLSATLWAICS